ncbi:MAG: phosphate acyltransferase [Ignavibacteriales bacterium]|nr:phosphate acyltransferase [Ignavibacteriales bacterium]
MGRRRPPDLLRLRHRPRPDLRAARRDRPVGGRILPHVPEGRNPSWPSSPSRPRAARATPWWTRSPAAVKLVKERDPKLLVDGEMQADAALVASVAAKQGPATRAVAGKANTLVFPDLQSGNIGYKLRAAPRQAPRPTGRSCRASRKPVSDLSARLLRGGHRQHRGAHAGAGRRPR